VTREIARRIDGLNFRDIDNSNATTRRVSASWTRLVVSARFARSPAIFQSPVVGVPLPDRSAIFLSSLPPFFHPSLATDPFGILAIDAIHSPPGAMRDLSPVSPPGGSVPGTRRLSTDQCNASPPLGAGRFLWLHDERHYHENEFASRTSNPARLILIIASGIFAANTAEKGRENA
jgi:hypothetical protein